MFRQFSKILSLFFFAFSLVLLIPFCVAIYYDFIAQSLYPISTPAFGITLAITITLGVFFKLIGRKTKVKMLRHQSVLTVVLIWVLAVLLSSLPFSFSKTLQNPLDAIFEATSGLTTTGSTILYPKAYNPETGLETKITLQGGTSKKESYSFYGTVTPIKNTQTGQVLLEGLGAVPKPILFWRSFIQWLGGMGIVLLFIIIFPALSIGGKFLMEAELGGAPYRENLTPRVMQTASLLWKIYLSLSILQIALLMLTNSAMPLFDAITITFSTISTGGFAPISGSIGAYQSAATEWIVMLFMIFGGMNFALYFYIIRGKIYKLYDPELLFFLLIILIGSLLIFWKLTPLHENPSKSFRQACFQLISSVTCTGFSTANYDYWPFACQALMLVVMYLGGMAGSTSGGIKSTRNFIMFKAVKYKLESLFRPDAMHSFKHKGRVIKDRSLLTVYAFFWIVIIFSTVGSLLLIFDNIDLETALGLITSATNNTGLTFRAAGPAGTCAFLPAFSKIILILWMMLGRLEFFAFLILLLPSFWRAR